MTKTLDTYVAAQRPKQS